MRALSWKQPYASLMLHGKIETRTWKTDYRGPVLICASQKCYNFNQILEISGKDLTDRAMVIIQSYEFGKAIAVGNLVGCRPMTKVDEDATFVSFREGLFCHVYENVREIEPFPWKGKQGWSTVPQEIIDKIVFK